MGLNVVKSIRLIANEGPLETVTGSRQAVYFFGLTKLHHPSAIVDHPSAVIVWSKRRLVLVGHVSEIVLEYASVFS